MGLGLYFPAISGSSDNMVFDGIIRAKSLTLTSGTFSMSNTNVSSSNLIDLSAVQTGTQLVKFSNNGVQTGSSNCVLFVRQDNASASSPAMIIQNDGTGNALEINSTTSAFLPPRMTNAQMVAFGTTSGSMVYNTTSGALYVWISGWKAITAA